MYRLIGADGQEYGPVSADVIREWVAQGRANAQTCVLPEGGTEWKTLSQIPELAAFLYAAAPPPTPFSVPQYRRTNTLAQAGLIMGVLSVTLGLCCCYGLPFNLIGVVCSSIALYQIKTDPQQTGSGVALTGLALSIASLLLGIVMFALALSFQTPDLWRKIQKL
jgi:hypothetical protein